MACTQGPHQVAQKSSRITFLPSSFCSSTGLPLTSVVVNAGAGWPSNGWGGSSGDSNSESACCALGGGVNLKSASVNFGDKFQSLNFTTYEAFSICPPEF